MDGTGKVYIRVNQIRRTNAIFVLTEQVISICSSCRMWKNRMGPLAGVCLSSGGY